MAPIKARLPSEATLGSRNSSMSPSAPVNTASGRGIRVKSPSMRDSSTRMPPAARSNPTRPIAKSLTPMRPISNSLMRTTITPSPRSISISIGAPGRALAGRSVSKGNLPPPKSLPVSTAPHCGSSSSTAPPSNTMPAPRPLASSKTTVARNRKSPVPIEKVECWRRLRSAGDTASESVDNRACAVARGVPRKSATSILP